MANTEADTPMTEIRLLLTSGDYYHVGRMYLVPKDEFEKRRLEVEMIEQALTAASQAYFEAEKTANPRGHAGHSLTPFVRPEKEYQAWCDVENKLEKQRTSINEWITQFPEIEYTTYWTP